MWTEEQLRMMIDERKNNNEYYNDLFEGRRAMWWKELASRINLRFGTRYSGKQVGEKFQGIVRDVKVMLRSIIHHHHSINY